MSDKPLWPISRRRPDYISVGLWLWVGAVLTFLFLPIALLVLFSFNTSPLSTFPLEGLSLTWYERVLNDPDFRHTLVNSLIVLAIAVPIGTAVGTSAALTIARYGARWRALELLAVISVLPQLLPALVLGVALLSLYHLLRLPLSLVTVGVGHALILTPFVTLIVLSRVRGFDFSVEEASRDLGATPWQTFRHVTFPLIRPSVLGAALIGASLSLDEFVVTFFTIGGQSTLPLYIWSAVRTTVLPTINAVATILLVTTTVVTVVGMRRFSIRL